MLTVKQAAKYACVCETIIRRWVANKQLAHFRVGSPSRRGKILIARQDLDTLLASLKVAGGSGNTCAPAPRSARPISLKHLRLG